MIKSASHSSPGDLDNMLTFSRISAICSSKSNHWVFQALRLWGEVKTGSLTKNIASGKNEARLGPPSPLLFTRGVTIFLRRSLQAERLGQAKYRKWSFRRPLFNKRLVSNKRSSEERLWAEIRVIIQMMVTENNFHVVLLSLLIVFNLWVKS